MQNNSCGGRSRLPARALNLARKLLQLLVLLKVWCHAEALWSGAEGAWRVLTEVKLPACPVKELAALLRPLIPSCILSVLHKSTKMCTQQSSTCHLFFFPVCKEASYLLSSGSWALVQHFVKCYRPFLPCYCFCFAERDVEAAKKCKLFFFFQWCKLSVLESIKKPEFVTDFLWPLNHAFPYIEGCLLTPFVP